MSATTANPSHQKPIRILMLHGFTQSGPLFSQKTKSLAKSLQKAFHPAPLDLVFPTAPHRIQPSDVPGYLSPHSESHGGPDDGAEPAPDGQGSGDFFGWWVRRGEAEPYVYEGIEAGLDVVGGILREKGPFDGVLGFSQGGALSAMVAALLEPGRRRVFDEAHGKRGGMAFPGSWVDAGGEGGLCGGHPPMKFAVVYSGFKATENKLYRGFYEGGVQTPVLHFLGGVDTVVEEARSLRLVEVTGEKELVRHPGGHGIASGRVFVGALVGFMQKALGWDGANGVGKGGSRVQLEEMVEDMDVPF